MDLTHQLNWRYIIKRNGAKLTTEKLKQIVDTIRSSASTFGLLPHTILVVQDEEQLKKIAATSNHPQLKTSSHVLVFTAWNSIKHENINEMIAHLASSKGLALDNMEDYKTTMKLMVKIPDQVKLQWCAKQAYIALGVGLTAAASQKVDATPIEEFDNEALDKILHLKEKGLETVVLLAMGQKNEASRKNLVKTPEAIHSKPLLFVN